METAGSSSRTTWSSIWSIPRESGRLLWSPVTWVPTMPSLSITAILLIRDYLHCSALGKLTLGGRT